MKRTDAQPCFYLKYLSLSCVINMYIISYFYNIKNRYLQRKYTELFATNLDMKHASQIDLATSLEILYFFHRRIKEGRIYQNKHKYKPYEPGSQVVYFYLSIFSKNVKCSQSIFLWPLFGILNSQMFFSCYCSTV